MRLLHLDVTGAKWANKHRLQSLEISTGEGEASAARRRLFLLSLPRFWARQTGNKVAVKGQLVVAHKWWNDSGKERGLNGTVMERERAVISGSRPLARLDWQAASPASSHSVEQRIDKAELSIPPAICLFLLLFTIRFEIKFDIKVAVLEDCVTAGANANSVLSHCSLFGGLCS